MVSEDRVYYGRRWMPRKTAELYRDYREACIELSEYRARGEEHPALLNRSYDVPDAPEEPTEAPRPKRDLGWLALIVWPCAGFLGSIAIVGAAWLWRSL